LQPEGLPEISRGLRSADIPGIVPNQIRILKGCQNASMSSGTHPSSATFPPKFPKTFI
jgi:hypothetical protein